jgi:hypothetical protein
MSARRTAMASDERPKATERSASTRRRFLKRLGESAVAGSAAWSLWQRGSLSGRETRVGQVAHRTLGKTGLDVSENGWRYA